MSHFFIGLDLGQCCDFTAIAVAERVEEPGAWDPAAFAWRKIFALHFRYLARVPLGTPYPDVAQQVVDLTQSLSLAGRCHLMVDATGVGRPVVDLLRRARKARPDRRGASRTPAGFAQDRRAPALWRRPAAAGHEQYGSWREGVHDDLAFAVALACWGAHKAGGW